MTPDDPNRDEALAQDHYGQGATCIRTGHPFLAREHFRTARRLDPARPEYERVKTQLQGKPFQEGMALLDAAWQRGELPITAPPEAEIWPTWAEGRFPWLIWRIEIVEQDSTGVLSGAPGT